MSRFFGATIGLAAGAALLAAWTSGPLRWWLLGGLGAGYAVLLGLGVAFTQLNFFTRAICRLERGQRKIALTFDDGPDRESTPRVLEELNRHGVQAAFFCVGRQVRQYPDTVRRLADQGHLVGNHTYHHSWWTNCFLGRRLEQEIHRAQEAIQEVLGAAPRYFRSPMGLTNPHLGPALKRAGLTLVGWDVRGLDYQARSVAPVVRRILRKTRDGSIIVLHDGGADPEIITEIVSRIIPELRRRGFTFQRLDGLIDEVPKEALG